MFLPDGSIIKLTNFLQFDLLLSSESLCFFSLNESDLEKEEHMKTTIPVAKKKDAKDDSSEAQMTSLAPS